jgi:hypothetical protein
MSIVKHIVILMISYDLLIHLAHLIFTREYLMSKRIIFWPVLYGRMYDYYWSVYWGIVLILVWELK